MRAIILAAGLGLRLQQPPQAQFPKCLLQFDGMSLLERHLQMLETAGVTDVVLALGFQPESVQAELERIQDVIWQAYENYAQRPEPERSDPSDID